MDYELMMNGNVRIGQRAPDFKANTTYGPVELNDYKGKWLVLFSHPGDFTPVKSYNLRNMKRLILLKIFSINKVKGKTIFSMILSLSRENDCTMSNSYISKLLNICNVQASRIINSLKKDI